MIPSTPARTSAFSRGRMLKGPVTLHSVWPKTRIANVTHPTADHAIPRGDARILFLAGLEDFGLTEANPAGSTSFVSMSSKSSNSSGEDDALPNNRRNRRLNFIAIMPIETRIAVGL